MHFEMKFILYKMKFILLYLIVADFACILAACCSCGNVSRHDLLAQWPPLASSAVLTRSLFAALCTCASGDLHFAVLTLKLGRETHLLEPTIILL